MAPPMGVKYNAEGSRNKAIADDLGISAKAFEKHRTGIIQKPGLLGALVLMEHGIERRQVEK